MNITGGEFKGQKIVAPDERITRPTLSKIRMAVFNTLQSIIDFEGKSFFDMYAGSGIMGLEALSRGFNILYSCEKNKEASKILQTNYKKFEKLREIKFFYGDSIKIAENFCKNNRLIDVTYIDPPYFSGIYEQSLEAVKTISKLIIIEHVMNVNFNGFKIIKQKQYGEKVISIVKSE